jgi:hypothetical protein
MPHPRSLALPLLALLLSLPAPSAALADEPAPLTDEQRQEFQAEAARLWKEAQAFDKEGKLTEALAAGEKMLVADRRLLGDQHKDIAFDLEWLATCSQRLENFDAAKKYREQVIAIKSRLLGKDHWQVTEARWALHHTELLASLPTEKRRQLDTAAARNADADRLRREERYAEALQAIRESGSIHRELLGTQHPIYAMSLSNLASVYDSKGDHARAEPLFVQALEIQKKALGEAHPDYAAILDDLASLYASQGHQVRAESLFGQSLEIRKKALGKTHPDYAESLNNLGHLYYSQGD